MHAPYQQDYTQKMWVTGGEIQPIGEYLQNRNFSEPYSPARESTRIEWFKTASTCTAYSLWHCDVVRNAIKNNKKFPIKRRVSVFFAM